jgi:hypothetical protein
MITAGGESRWVSSGTWLTCQIYAVEIAAPQDRGFVSSFTLMTGNFFGLLAAGVICELDITLPPAPPGPK